MRFKVCPGLLGEAVGNDYPYSREINLQVGVVAIPSVVMAALLLSWSFRNASRWQVIHPATSLIAVGMLAAVVSMIVDVGMPGLQQRAFLLLLLLWLSIVVHRLVRVTAVDTGAPRKG